MIKFEGLFFDNETINVLRSHESNTLSEINKECHITFCYKPSDDQLFDDIVGREITVKVTGYGNDGNNSGFRVLIPSHYMKYYLNDKTIPHITMSLAKGAEAVNTKNVLFEDIEEFEITGKFGYMICDKTGEYVYYEKVK